MDNTAERIPKKAAEVHPVREVTLTGTAEREPFVKMLDAQALRPMLVDGQAQLFMSATDTRFFGVRFREFSISVLLDDPAAAARNEKSAFLIQAFNSVRFFAWVERKIFSTPYEFASINVETTVPAQVEVARGGQQLIKLQMANIADRQPQRHGDEDWAGRVHLPVKQGNSAPADAKMFFARLSNPAEVYAAHPDDLAAFHAHADFPILQQIREADFRPNEWLIRTQGRHMKTKTVSRNWGRAFF